MLFILLFVRSSQNTLFYRKEFEWKKKKKKDPKISKYFAYPLLPCYYALVEDSSANKRKRERGQFFPKHAIRA